MILVCDVYAYELASKVFPPSIIYNLDFNPYLDQLAQTYYNTPSPFYDLLYVSEPLSSMSLKHFGGPAIKGTTRI